MKFGTPYRAAESFWWVFAVLGDVVRRIADRTLAQRLNLATKLATPLLQYALSKRAGWESELHMPLSQSQTRTIAPPSFRTMAVALLAWLRSAMLDGFRSVE